MAITNGYTTLAAVKDWLGISDSVDDARLERAVESASRAIDLTTGRRFWVDGSDVTRTFTAESTTWLRIPDLSTITSLKTDDNGDRAYETTWASTDYDTEPTDGIVSGIGGWPATTVIARPDKTRSFPVTRRGVEIVGKWGWAAIPTDIVQAALVLAARIFRRKDSPDLVAGSSEFGVIRVARSDPDFRALIEPYIRVEVIAVG